MKKSNRIIVITITLIIFMLSFITINIYQMHSEKKEVINNNKSVLKQNTLSMMLETSEGSGEYTISENNSWPTGDYVMNTELSGCENGSKLTWDPNNVKIIVEANTSDKCYIYFDIDSEPVLPPEPESSLFVDYIKRQYLSDGVNSLYYHGDALANGAADYSYRYAGANPNNYVCFGSNETTCNDSNLYRIIGVFMVDGEYRVKLIKHNPYGAYAWSGSSSNKSQDWSRSTFNTRELNSTYLTDVLGTDWSAKIASSTWYVGGLSDADAGDYGARHAFDYEVGQYKDSTATYVAKVGLMYLSDYYYAASPQYWTYVGYYNASKPSYNAAVNYDWLRLPISNISEWFISPCTDDTIAVYVMDNDRSNGLASAGVNGSSTYARPTFYLTTSVEYVSGTGTYSSPYRIS